MRGDSSDADARSWTLDERAEVVNLTRNIVFASEDDQYAKDFFGAHMMITRHTFAYIDNVEITRAGQMGVLGRYPFHWHDVGAAQGQYIKNSSIHDTYQRCVTVHSTHYALVERNTCYNHFGHGYFLELGNERKNVIRNNIAISSKKIPVGRNLLDSDTHTRGALFPAPASYWITNPDNEYSGNVAAGSEGTGFWMAYTKTADCDHAEDCEGFDHTAPSRLDLLKFENNTAHSSSVGLSVDGAPEGDLTNNPLNPDDRRIVSAFYAPKTEPVFKGLTVYKNRTVGVWPRGSNGVFENAVFADNPASVRFTVNQSISNSLFVGLSRNHNDQDFEKYTALMGPKNRMVGMVVYDGQNKLSNVHFANYPAQPRLYNGKDYTPSVFSYVPAGARNLVTTNRLSFAPMPARLFGMDEISRGATAASSVPRKETAGIFYDQDGSLSGVANTYIASAINFNRYADCTTVLRDPSAVSCPHETALVTISRFVTDQKYVIPAKFVVTRSDGVSELHGDQSSMRPFVIATKLNTPVNYKISEMAWDPQQDHALTLGYINPKNSPSPVFSITDLPASCVANISTAAGSLAQLASSTSDAYFRDGSTLHFKFAKQRGVKITCH